MSSVGLPVAVTMRCVGTSRGEGAGAQGVSSDGAEGAGAAQRFGEGAAVVVCP